MTEPKVVHEWVEDGGKYRIHATEAGPMLYVVRPSLQSPCQFIKEMACLAARVEELEQYKAEREAIDAAVSVELVEIEVNPPDYKAENTRLRKALEMISTLHSYGTLGDLNTYKEKVRGYARAALKETSDV